MIEQARETAENVAEFFGMNVHVSVDESFEGAPTLRIVHQDSDYVAVLEMVKEDDWWGFLTEAPIDSEKNLPELVEEFRGDSIYSAVGQAVGLIACYGILGGEG